MIPKIIHYCWFGGKKKPPLLKACIKSFNKIGGGYQVIEWNETNCNLEENAFVKKMYDEKRYAFVSDYFRLKALHEMGGIYFDTDVIVYKRFDKLLAADFFCGFIYDCALGTAVIGARKNSPIIENLLEIYRKNLYGDDVVNNGVFTQYFYHQVKGFRLNGKRQSLKTETGEQIEIFPKETFETGKRLGRSYSLHFADGSWHPNGKKTSYKVKILAAKLPVNLMSIRQHKKANCYMKQDGEYQRWYYETIKTDVKRIR